MNPRNIKIRLAVNADGPIVGSIVEQENEAFSFDWSDIYPYWLVAEHEGEIIGAIQVAYSKPMGRIETLCFREGVIGKTRAITAKKLAMHAASTLRIGGCQGAVAVILDGFEGWKRIAARRGWKSYGNGVTFVKRFPNAESVQEDRRERVQADDHGQAA